MTEIPPSIQAIKDRERLERINRLEDFIFIGMQTIQSGYFEQSVSYFTNPDMAKSVGLKFELGRCMILSHTLSDPDEIRKTAHRLAAGSSGPNRRSRSTEISPGSLGPSDTNIQVPPILRQEEALLHLEEWLHALQYVKWEPLAGFKDSEIDVAAYMINHSIPLTEFFLERYDRRSRLLTENSERSV